MDRDGAVQLERAIIILRWSWRVLVISAAVYLMFSAVLPFLAVVVGTIHSGFKF